MKKQTLLAALFLLNIFNIEIAESSENNQNPSPSFLVIKNAH